MSLGWTFRPYTHLQQKVIYIYIVWYLMHLSVTQSVSVNAASAWDWDGRGGKHLYRPKQKCHKLDCAEFSHSGWTLLCPEYQGSIALSVSHDPFCISVQMLQERRAKRRDGSFVTLSAPVETRTTRLPMMTWLERVTLWATRKQTVTTLSLE